GNFNMASSLRKGESKIESNDGEEDSFVFVYDRRSGDNPETKIHTGGLFSFNDFKGRVREALGIGASEKFVIATTNREEIHDDETWDQVDNEFTLYVLHDVNQELTAPAEERVSYLPHYDTIVKGGMYEYYASEGQNPLPYAFAELIDNALAATADNVGSRNIEIRLHFDDANPSKNYVFVIDNGKGMTSKQLNNWAIYRLSKFRRDKYGKLVNREDDDDKRSDPGMENAPRSLNSDISYFGVGGKQAIFFIGNSSRMISKAKGSNDVHELNISKEEFERKEKNRESIYSGFIRNRVPGDVSHISADDENVRRLVAEEKDKDSFTAVVVNGVNPEHIPYLKIGVKSWTRQLAHIYHYYIHGPNGNTGDGIDSRSSPFKNIDIQVKMYFKGQSQPKVINLRDIDDDMQTQFIKTAASSFEFKAKVEGTGMVEGVLRYHPFLYDKETYPSDANDPRVEPDPEEDHMYAMQDTRPARGKRAIFECYWNGRLIPYTLIDDFDWCATPKKQRNIPLECYNRTSGVLWTNDKFQVSTNKLTFIDLEMRLRDKQTVFSRVISGHEKRTAIDKELIAWLKECHELTDKQIKFTGFGGTTTRHDLPRSKQSPWSVFSSIEWAGKTYKKGQIIKLSRTLPVVYGTIKKFMLYGDHEGDVYATGGDIEVTQEPASLYDEVKVFPLTKLDRTISPQLIRKYIEEEESKLPSKLLVTWPEGNEVKHGEKRAAGRTVGDIKVEIANRKGELISKLPGTAGQAKRLLMELKVIWHSNNGDEQIVQHISQHGKTWPYWFRKMENVKNLGSHTLILQAVLNESGANMFAGRELPSHRIKFSVTEAEPEKFVVGLLDGPFRIGSPFQIPLEFQDEFNNATKPSTKFKPELEASGLELNYESCAMKGNNLVLKGIVAIGSVPTNTGKNFTLEVKIAGLEFPTQTLKIRMLPGPPSKIFVKQQGEIELENNGIPSLDVEVQDIAGNPTAQPKLNVVCKFQGVPGLPVYTVDCSNTGGGTLTGDPIQIKHMKGEQKLIAKIELPGVKGVNPTERILRVLPSSRPSTLILTYTGEDEQVVAIKNNQELHRTAGDYLKGLAFKVKDEAGKDIDIDKKLADKIKVNWTSLKNLKEFILKGTLPDVRVPNSSADSKYCHMNFTDGSGLDFSFTIRSEPGKAAIMKSKFVGGVASVRIGDVLNSQIHIVVKDKYGNEVKQLPPEAANELEVTGDGLNVPEVETSSKGSCFVVTGVRFEGGNLGLREVTFTWRDITDYVRVQLQPGAPSKIILPGWNMEQPLSVTNLKKLSTPIMVQLTDKSGNPTHEPNLRVQLAKDVGLKLTPAPIPLKTDAKGCANFGQPCVEGKRGLYEVQPKAFIGRNCISGPKIRISIQPDSSKPSELVVEYDKNVEFNIGGVLPDYVVKVLSEDDTPMNTAKTSALHMYMWPKPYAQKSEKIPPYALKQSPDPRRRNDEGGVFRFRERKIPEKAVPHCIVFSYQDGNIDIQTNQIMININPGPPAKLCPNENMGMPVVSNAKNKDLRCVFKSLTLSIQDTYGNQVGGDLDGSVTIEIIGDKKTSEIPLFQGKSNTVTCAMTKGTSCIQNIYLEENSPGKDNHQYTLRFTVKCASIPKNKAIPPYETTFQFHNNVKKQSQMASFSKERDTLKDTIEAYRSWFETAEQLVNELTVSKHEANLEEQRLRNELRKQNVPVSHLASPNTVKGLVATRTAERDTMLDKPRRMCGLQPAPKHKEVLGKIAHLAQVEDAAIARVLSWHMSADMDCVVTLTTKKAKEIYNVSNGKQQVLPIDSIYKKNVPDWNRPMPHSKVKPGWKPPGHPVYARHLLEFPLEEEHCRIVFGMLLGDTLILDTLDHANSYRQEIVKFTHCPTILTRTGDRVRSNGKFGGMMNKAVPIEKLRGAVFSEPLPVAYHAVCTQIDTLQDYCNAMERNISATNELQEQLEKQKQPDEQAKKREYEEAKEQLAEIERKMGMIPPVMKRSASNHDEEPVVKKPALTPAKSPKQSASMLGSPVTPTRQSTRKLTRKTPH
ncbi:unnamed protein product, partial [Owenia fusiformis]